MKQFILILSLSFIAIPALPQQLQGLRGTVRDAASDKALPGVQLLLSGDADYRTITDSTGQYLFDVPAGTYSLQIFSEHYKAQLASNIIIFAGRQQLRDFHMEELKYMLPEVSISASAKRQEENIDMWDFQRFAAAFYDPARVVESYAGVANTNDQANNISIRGTSPVYMQWRLEDVEIVGPNHLENAGTVNDRPTPNGGGVSMLSAQLLQNSGFILPPFDGFTGNALSGAFDMKLRNGNEKKFQHIIQVSLLGTDICMEGPLTKKRQASFLVNYRYSTIGLLTKLGVNFGDERTTFQDLSYVVNIPAGRGTFKFFGSTGASETLYSGKTDSAEVTIQKELQNIDYHAFTSINGLSYIRRLSETMYYKSVFAWSVKRTTRNAAPDGLTLAALPFENDRYTTEKFSSVHYVSKRIGASLKLRAGTYINYFINDLTSSSNDIYFASGRLESLVLQPFITWEEVIGRKLKYQAGVHSIMDGRTSRIDILPSAKIIFTLTDREDLSIGYSRQAQLQPAFLQLSNKQNRNLPPTISDVYALSYNYYFKMLEIRNQLYYQFYQRIPVNENYNFSAFNYFNEQVMIPLDAKGNAIVYGYDLTVKQDNRFLYWIAAGSIFDSRCSSSNGYVQGRFNSGYNAAITIGKEFPYSNKTKFFSVDARAISRNGFLTRDESLSTDYSYTERLPSYFRIDLRLSLRRNRTRSSSILALDIQNVTARKNVGYYYNDVFTGKRETSYQLGLVPVLSYKVMF